MGRAALWLNLHAYRLPFFILPFPRPPPPPTRDPSAFLLDRYHGPGMTVGLRGAEKASRGESVCRLWGRAVCGCTHGQPSLALCRQRPGRPGVMQHRGHSCRTEHSPASPGPHAPTNQVQSAMRPPPPGSQPGHTTFPSSPARQHRDSYQGRRVLHPVNQQWTWVQSQYSKPLLILILFWLLPPFCCW